MPELKNKQGYLTAYGLACGYIERYELGALSVQLWHEGCYHVRLHDNYYGRLWWHSCHNLTEARRLYRRTKSRMNRKLIADSDTGYYGKIKGIFYPGVSIEIPRDRTKQVVINRVSYSRDNAAKIIRGVYANIKMHLSGV